MKTPVIDFHAHVGRWGSFGMADDLDMYLRVMDAAGVDMACINCIFYGEAKRNLDAVIPFVRKHPDRFVPVAYVTPRYPQDAIAELERAFGELGAKFLKLYPTYLTKPIDDPSYFPIFEWANDHEIVIMSHSSFASEGDTLTKPSLFSALARRYSKVRWVLGHSGNSMAGQVLAVAAAKECSNIYLETCTSMAEAGTIEFLVNGAGEDRVMFGSDMPLMDARNQVGRIVTADISDEAKQKVLGLSAIKLLGLQSMFKGGSLRRGLL